MAKSLPARLRAFDTTGSILLAFSPGEERDQLVAWLEEAGYQVALARDSKDAAKTVTRRLDVDVLIAERAFCEGGPNLLEAAQGSPAGLKIILAGQADVFVITKAIALGAYSFLPHPVTHADLLAQVGGAVLAARRTLLAEDRRLARPAEVEFEGIVGTTPRMREVMDILRKAAPTDAPVVIFGETGTGKELIAQAVHRSSKRAKGPFVALHLHATPDGLVESELFGHKKGAFTGAVTDRVGKLEQADGGTLFLDELGDIPLPTQTKLLRVLETSSFEPVGSNRTVRSNFRLIAATNQDVEAKIQDKSFREELWYRLKVVSIELPPLRERRADIPLLVERFLKEYAERYGKELDGVDPEALALLQRHPWTGNIRELRNVIQHMVVLAEEERLTVRDLPREMRGEEAADVGALPGPSLAGRTMEEIERDAIRETLKLTEGNRKAAAEMLQIGERTLYRKIEKYGL